MSISAPIVRVVVSEAVFHGVDEARLFAESGVDARALDDPSARIPLEHARRVVRAAVEGSGRPELGLCIGSTAPLGALQILAAGFEHGATLRQAAGFFQRFGALIVDGVELELIDGPGRSGIRLHEHRTVDPLNRRFWSEFVLTVIARVARGALGRDGMPRAIHFRHTALAPVSRYREVLLCEPEFEQAENEILFESDVLDRPCNHFDETLCRFVVTRAEGLLASLEHSKRLAPKVEELISVATDLADVDPARISAQLGLSTRTFRRRLHDEATSWTELLDRERRRRSLEALESTDVPIKELADRLGYSDANAFVRAFSRWAGKTPAAFRRERRSVV